jgi:polar amino acid transport system permease protein
VSDRDDGSVPGPPGAGTPIPTGDRRSKILGGGSGTRSAAIAVVSTVLFFGIVGLVLVNSPGWATFKQFFLDGAIFVESWPKIVDAFKLNVFIYVVAEILVLGFALVLAVMRSLPGPVFAPLRVFAVGYSMIFRGVPTILVIFTLGFGMPALELQGLPSGEYSDIFWAIIALTLVYSAYVAEVYRAGIESVHPSQTAAARSLGLRRGQAMRFVVLPQAVRRVVPPLLNDFIGLQKDSALIGLLGVTEALRRAQIDQATFFNFTPYVALALVYILITIPQVLFVDWLIRRDQRRRQTGAVA